MHVVCQMREFLHLLNYVNLHLPAELFSLALKFANAFKEDEKTRFAIAASKIPIMIM